MGSETVFTVLLAKKSVKLPTFVQATTFWSFSSVLCETVFMMRLRPKCSSCFHYTDAFSACSPPFPSSPPRLTESPNPLHLRLDSLQSTHRSFCSICILHQSAAWNHLCEWFVRADRKIMGDCWSCLQHWILWRHFQLVGPWNASSRTNVLFWILYPSFL